MAKKIIKKYFPDTTKFRDHRHLKMFGSLLNSPNLWHFNRYSVSMAFSVGLFTALIPVPFQMVLAAALAILFRANLPISVALVWITNPFTMPPIFYFAFKLGAYVLDVPPTGFHFEASISWLTTGFLHIWKPFLMGCLIVGTLSALLSNIIIRLIWRYTVTRLWQARRLKRKRSRLLRDRD